MTRRRTAFTLLELLITIAIVFLLISAAAFGLRTARRSAARVESLNALKQMVLAYTAYATDHKGKLMPGYIDPADIGTLPGQLNIKARLESGYDLPPADTSSYVWRLAPYLDHDWSVFFTDYRSNGLMTTLVNEYGSGDAGGVYGPAGATPPQYGIASVPAYGLNSLFLGGDSFHADLGDLAPWRVAPGTKPLAASRLSEVKNPAKIVVFAPTQAPEPASGTTIPLDPASGARIGYMELRAPMWHAGNPGNVFTDLNGTPIERQWKVDPADNRIVKDPTGTEPMGVPIDRLGDNKIPVAHLDGSTNTELVERLALDMSRWSPFVVTQN
jgi:type II secretory pathway pseudopilin PulG